MYVVKPVATVPRSGRGLIQHRANSQWTTI
jgi:hypothetical protein